MSLGKGAALRYNLVEMLISSRIFALAAAAVVIAAAAATAARPTPALPLAGAGLPLAAPATIAADPASAQVQKAEPPWWEMKMTIEGRGEYESRLDARQTRYSGSFAFAFVWSGALHKDGQDYLLVHNACDLTAWRIEERGSADETITTLTTADVGDKPELKVNYVLRKEDGLHIAFEVTGFDVPKLAGADAFPLVLPVSAEHGASAGGRKYDLFVKSGSNKVVIDEDRLARGPVDKAFAWTWKNQGWVQKQEGNVFQSSSHEARVRIVITPKGSGLNF